MLLRPGRGPLRPRAVEAGKEARRLERGMFHPEEPELETLHPGGTALPGLTGETGGELTWQGPAPGTRSPLLPALALARPLEEGAASSSRSLKKSWAKSATCFGQSGLLGV